METGKHEVEGLLKDILSYLRYEHPPSPDDPCARCGHPRNRHAGGCTYSVVGYACECPAFVGFGPDDGICAVRAKDGRGKEIVVGPDAGRLRLVDRIVSMLA